MYDIIRSLIGGVFLACSILAIVKSKLGRKRPLYFACVCASFLLIWVLEFLPFENSFVTFDSPQAAYDYYTLEKPNIELVVEGDNCDLVIDRQSHADHYLIIPKSADGWKIGINSDTKMVFQKIADGTVIRVYQYKNTSDLFLTILNGDGEEATVTDDRNTTFYSLGKYNAALGATVVTYYAHITDLDPEYSVTVNDNRIVLKD